MLSGIGILIALKQVPHFIGYDPDPTIDFVYRHGNETTFTKINEAFIMLRRELLLFPWLVFLRCSYGIVNT